MPCLCFSKRADHGKKLAVDDNFLADAVLRRLRKQNSSGVVAQQNDGGTMLRVGFIEEAAVLNLQIKNLSDGRLIPLQNHIFGAVGAAAHVGRPGTELRLENAHRRRRGLDVREPGDIFRPLRLKFLAGEPFTRRPRERSPGKTVSDDGVRAQRANAAEHVFIEAVDHRRHGDDGGDADDNP